MNQKYNPKHNQEQEIHRLSEELRTANISHGKRVEFEKKLHNCRLNYQNHQHNDLLSAFLKNFEDELTEIDYQMACCCVDHAEAEISKHDKQSAEYLGLENIRKELKSKTITPSVARREVKNICRHCH